MEAHETVRCRGHPLVVGTHPTTFEVTREAHLSGTGNCIIGLSADKGCLSLAPDFKSILANDDAVLVTRLECGGASAEIRSRGSSQMLLDHPSDMVWRRSTYVCGRTIGILSDHVARTLPRDLIRNLANGEEMEVSLTVTRPG
jgi:hypothetical protein